MGSLSDYLKEKNNPKENKMKEFYVKILSEEAFTKCVEKLEELGYKPYGNLSSTYSLYCPWLLVKEGKYIRSIADDDLKDLKEIDQITLLNMKKKKKQHRYVSKWLNGTPTSHLDARFVIEEREVEV